MIFDVHLVQKVCCKYAMDGKHPNSFTNSPQSHGQHDYTYQNEMQWFIIDTLTADKTLHENNYSDRWTIEKLKKKISINMLKKTMGN